MTRFLSEKYQSNEYKNAVTALRMLLDIEPENAVRAFAEATSEFYKKEFTKGLIECNRGKDTSVKRLTNSKETRLPGDDHTTFYLENRKINMAICQPYQIAGIDDLRKMVEFCDKYNLDVDIRSHPSWHFPGRTLTIIYTKRESS